MNWRGTFGRGYHWVRSQDLLVLLLGLSVIGGAWLFLELADEVSEGETRKLDEKIVMSLRAHDDPGDPLGPVWLEESVRDLTALGSTIVLLFLSLAVLGFLLMRRQGHAAGLVLAALAGGLLLNFGLKNYFDRPRPELVPHLHHVSTASFPSGHSLLSAVVYLTLGALLARLVQERRLKIYILAVAGMMSLFAGASRVYLGVHYPTDVLGGWTVGLTWAVICWLVARHLQRRGAVEQPQ